MSGNRSSLAVWSESSQDLSAHQKMKQWASWLFPALNFLLFLVGIVSVGLSKEKGLLTLDNWARVDSGSRSPWTKEKPCPLRSRGSQAGACLASAVSLGLSVVVWAVVPACFSWAAWSVGTKMVFAAKERKWVLSVPSEISLGLQEGHLWAGRT